MKGRPGEHKMTCPQCSSRDMTIQARSNLGGTGHNEAIQTEMLGCAIIYKYLVCNSCGRIITRDEYRDYLRFQEPS